MPGSFSSKKYLKSDLALTLLNFFFIFCWVRGRQSRCKKSLVHYYHPGCGIQRHFTAQNLTEISWKCEPGDEPEGHPVFDIESVLQRIYQSLHYVGVYSTKNIALWSGIRYLFLPYAVHASLSRTRLNEFV